MPSSSSPHKTFSIFLLGRKKFCQCSANHMSENFPPTKFGMFCDEQNALFSAVHVIFHGLVKNSIELFTSDEQTKFIFGVFRCAAASTSTNSLRKFEPFRISFEAPENSIFRASSADRTGNERRFADD